jgi:hypothetical protein
VSQIAMFQETTSAPDSGKRPVPALAEECWYDDAGPTVARYWITLPNPHFGDWISAGLRVDIERQVGRRPITWMASVSLELPDEHRTHWGQREVSLTQDEAAEVAAAMLHAARHVLDAAIRGEPVETPGQRRQKAAEAHVETLPEYRAAVSRMDADRATRAKIGAFNDGHHEAYHRFLVAKAQAEDVRQQLLDAFYAAHGWREFAEVPHVAR